MWHGRSPAERQYTETLQIANVASAKVYRIVAYAAIAVIAVISLPLFDGLLR